MYIQAALKGPLRWLNWDVAMRQPAIFLNSDILSILLIDIHFVCFLDDYDPPEISNHCKHTESWWLAQAGNGFLLDNSKYLIWALANHFEVLHSTLQDQLAGAVSHSEEMTSWHHLSPTETNVLAEHATEMQKLHFLLTPQDIRLKAQHLWYSKDPAAEACGNKLGVNWYSWVFLKNNPEMVNKMGKCLDQDQATCASYAQLAVWYEDVCFYLLSINP